MKRMINKSIFISMFQSPEIYVINEIRNKSNIFDLKIQISNLTSILNFHSIDENKFIVHDDNKLMCYYHKNNSQCFPLFLSPFAGFRPDSSYMESTNSIVVI
jgi:hypothetical protein